MTKQRKYRIANKARFTAFIAVLVIAATFILIPALGFNTASGASTQQYIQVRVEAGDTLWTLAQEYGPSGMDVRNVIYEICQLNGITAADLQAGQYITIPTEL
ncbi:MAG: LysM peptidoglycan-binding domain-containing protein [Firmicutes bacterium]|nr:LysM peptidoglycan-binding domain-containing protein [Bacillota bacterium]